MTPVDLLLTWGAAEIDHPGGTLLDHLVRVSERLASWGCAPEVVLAGLAHAAYSTDGYDTALLPLEERDLLRGCVGEAAEELVYRFAATDRRPFYRQLDQSLVVWTDRWDGTSVTLDPPDVRPLVDLTVANELDVVDHAPEVREEYGEALRKLFVRARTAMSEAAWADVQRTLG
jgi:hypothetical protein